jgi:hypothetical protein
MKRRVTVFKVKHVFGLQERNHWRGLPIDMQPPLPGVRDSQQAGRERAGHHFQQQAFTDITDVLPRSAVQGDFVCAKEEHAGRVGKDRQHRPATAIWALDQQPNLGSGGIVWITHLNFDGILYSKCRGDYSLSLIPAR